MEQVFSKQKIKSQDRTSKEISFRNAIIATGSKPSSFPYLRIDKNRIISSFIKRNTQPFGYYWRRGNWDRNRFSI